MKTTVFYYHFDIADPEQERQYKRLKTELRLKGLKVFRIMPANFDTSDVKKVRDFVQAPENKGQNPTLELDTKHLFSNQWNVFNSHPIGRAMDWKQAIYNNPNIKEGYYLEQTQEMTAIRANTLKCSWCGKYYSKEAPGFMGYCTACLGSEYMKQSDLVLLRLRAISDTPPGPGDPVPDWLLQEYFKQHRIMLLDQFSKRVNEQERQNEKDRQDQATERAAFGWLADNGIDFRNAIFYPHIQQFNFNWQHNMSAEEVKDLRGKLADFPYAYKITP